MISERSFVLIDLDSFRFNLCELKRQLYPNQSFMQIVKADAYGHGALETAKIALSEGAAYLGVANVEEGKLLRLQGITAPILILSPSYISEIPEIISNNLSVSISDLDFAEELNHQAKLSNQRVSVHFKIDTGMHRSGAPYSIAMSLYESIVKLDCLHVEGIYSHYAASESDYQFTLKQEKQFSQFLGSIPSKPRYSHISNSSGVLEHNSNTYNMVRFGILSYGVYTSQHQVHKIALKPVMTFKSTISQVKRINKGESIGYNLTWKAAKDTTYAIVPVGYADGYDFLLGNQAVVEVRETICDVIGKVSMDMITIDISHIPNASIGDEVTLLGGTSNLLRVESLTALFNGSAYELLCQIGRRARRHYIHAGSIVSSSPLSRREFVSTDFNDSKLNQIIESAISQRLQSDEIGELIYREILKSFFFNKDQDIHYRQNFYHSISLNAKTDDGAYYETSTKLSFEKVLQNEYFIVACATSDIALNRYFRRRDVEYRWLMDSSIKLDSSSFSIARVTIGSIDLDTSVTLHKDCLEIRCSHPELNRFVGQKVKFDIETKTLYPVSKHQLTIYITELTRGVSVELQYPHEMNDMEIVSIFSGQNRYPKITKGKNSIKMQTSSDEWVFPMSGIVFAY